MMSIATLDNGLTLIVEEADYVESAAYELLIPGGVILDQPDLVGESLVLGELMSRGAGPLDSRGLSNAFDDLGIRHAEGTSFDRYVFRGSLLAEHLPRALELVSHIVLNPTLPEPEIPAIQSLLLQDLASLNDYPARRVMVELSSRYFPAPYSRPTLGTEQGIKGATRSRLAELIAAGFKPKGAVLSVAGRVSTKAVQDTVARLFSSWSGTAPTIPAAGVFPSRRYEHITSDSTQVHIAMSYPSSPFGSDDYYAAKVAQGILSGGMFGRLFIEVREKKGLCYSIHARHNSTKDYGVVTAYAGTTTERAQETLDAMRATLREVGTGISAEELNRAVANIKANLIMAEESVASRASSNASDWFVGGRVRTLEEIRSGIEAVTTTAIVEQVKRYPVEPAMIVTLGKQELKV